MPALNEEESIRAVLEDVPSYVDQVIVINDGSTDRTAEIASATGATVLNHNMPMGLGVVFLTGIREALRQKFDVLVNMDSDGQFDPKDIEKLVSPIIDGQADFVTASRFANKELIPKMPKAKLYGNRLMSRLISFLTGRRFYDVSCGFRAYSFDTVLKINLFGKYTYTQETFLDLAFKQAQIREVPVSVLGEREHGESKIASNLFLYAYKSITIILRSFRDYKPLRLCFFVFTFCFLLGLGFFIFLLIHYVQAGSFSPHKWAGFTGSFFMGIGFLFIGLGFILDMFARMRINQELILYELKRREYSPK